MLAIRRVGLVGLGLALVLSTALALPQNTVHVDADAAPGGDGSAAAPFQTIQSAVDAATTLAGDTVLVAPGVYVGRVSVPFGRALTVRSSHGPLATVICASVGADTARFASGSLEGFTVLKESGGGPDARVVSCDTGAWVRRCIVLGAPMLDGIAFDGGSAEHCLVSECRYATRFFGYPSGTVSNSILWNNSHPTVVDSNSPGSPSFRYCVVDHVLGSGPSTNLDVAPLVRSFTSRDFHLRSTSPCIDAGDPSAPLDPDGSRADIGPLPFDASWMPFAVYCTAQVNSLGCTPAIGAEGNASASAAVPFEITCSNTLNNRTGLLFYGYGPRATAYQGGFLCVASPLRRTALLDSGGSSTGTDCSGVFAFDFNAHLQGGVDPLLEPGVEVFAQFWSRDPGASFPTHRSDALRFAVLP
ncbi:MAG: hypothetical protein HUU28_11030 [Planctomycetaceae bacterium]|nr:hypothetical protein [Planctomycetaceae bacterium]